MPNENNVRAIGLAVVGGVSTMLILGAIASFNSFASEEDLKEVEVASIKRDEAQDAKHTKIVEAFTKALLEDASFKAEIRADLKYLKEKRN